MDASEPSTPEGVEGPRGAEGPRGGEPAPDGVAARLTEFPAPARWATRGRFRPWSWEALLHRVSKPDLWPGGGSIAHAEALLGAWTFARFRDDTRVAMRDEALAARETAARVVEVHGLAVEYEDEPTVDEDHIRRWWGEYTYVAHTTGFHEQEKGDKPAGPRWRVLLPFAAPVSLEDAVAIGAWARHPRHAVGIVHDRTDEAWRYFENPAVAPGGYRWTSHWAAFLDPRAALAQLREWREADTRHAARDALQGTHVGEAVTRFLARHAEVGRRPFFPLPGPRPSVAPIDDGALAPRSGAAWPELSVLLGPLWPGRLVAVVGGGGAGRSAFALQIAESAARAGHPVLHVLLRMGSDEAVARLLALGASGRVGAAALLQGAGSQVAVEGACRALVARYPALYLWAPAGLERTADGLRRRVTAVSDAYDHRPPLVVMDTVEGWAADGRDEAGGVREVVSVLRDLAHAGTPTRSWPGAAVVLVTGVPRPTLGEIAGARALAEAFESGRLGEIGALGPAEADAGAVIVLASDAGRDALAVVAKNRDGRRGVVHMRFDPVRGRFDEGPRGRVDEVARPE